VLSSICVVNTGEERVGVMKRVLALMSVGSSHTSYCTREGLKVGRHHGNMVGSASHSELHNAILYLWPTLEPLQWDRVMEWRDT
jgi:hypothetical protein